MLDDTTGRCSSRGKEAKEVCAFAKESLIFLFHNLQENANLIGTKSCAANLFFHLFLQLNLVEENISFGTEKKNQREGKKSDPLHSTDTEAYFEEYQQSISDNNMKDVYGSNIAIRFRFRVWRPRSKGCDRARA